MTDVVGETGIRAARLTLAGRFMESRILLFDPDNMLFDSPRLKDADFVADPEGDWCKSGGRWTYFDDRQREHRKLPRFRITVSILDRMSRDSAAAADAVLRALDEE